MPRAMPDAPSTSPFALRRASSASRSSRSARYRLLRRRFGIFRGLLRLPDLVAPFVLGRLPGALDGFGLRDAGAEFPEHPLEGLAVTSLRSRDGGLQGFADFGEGAGGSLERPARGVDHLLGSLEEVAQRLEPFLDGLEILDLVEDLAELRELADRNETDDVEDLSDEIRHLALPCIGSLISLRLG
jgi:hypothetical protein